MFNEYLSSLCPESLGTKSNLGTLSRPGRTKGTLSNRPGHSLNQGRKHRESYSVGGAGCQGKKDCQVALLAHILGILESAVLLRDKSYFSMRADSEPRVCEHRRLATAMDVYVKSVSVTKNTCWMECLSMIPYAVAMAE